MIFIDIVILKNKIYIIYSYQVKYKGLLANIKILQCG